MGEERTRSLLLLAADPAERRLISAVAARANWSVVGAADEETAVALFQGPHGREVQAALLTNWDPETGPRLIAALRDQRERLPVIVLSTGESVSTAVDAMRAGASDFLVRPVAPERLTEALAANSDRRKAAGELAPLSEKMAPDLSLEQLIGAAPEFRSALAVAAKAARNRLPILIIGEAGTGKETIARAIHSASLRARGPLLLLDCKAVPANIIDSELFGHACPVNVDRVDLFHRGDTDSPSAAFDQLGVDRLALLDRQVLGIVDPARELVAVEDAGAGHNRPCQRRAPGLIHARERLGEFELELEGAAPRHRPKPMEPRVESLAAFGIFCG